MTTANVDLSHDEDRTVEEHARPGAHLIYEIIRRDGEEEMARPNASLLWSGIAAGLLISMSVYAEAALRAGLPDTQWRPLVENFGYSVGFLIVILGRLQLFTENTITTVAPVLHEPSRANFARMGTLWGIVFGANVIGATLAAMMFLYAPVATPEISAAIGELSRHIFDMTPAETFWRGIIAGILIATIVWMLPNSQGAGFWVILLFTYLIALGDLAHVVAGSVEAAYAFLKGDVTLFTAVFGFLLPAFAGNVVGGTLVFTLLVYAQVNRELDPDYVQ